MVIKVDKSEEFIKDGRKLISEYDSESWLRKSKKMRNEEKDGFFDNQAEWADGFCGK
tara:strand:+ start:1007 stop:1177 length:171 start_codon:yes stop_codon:yes gene_type:complete